MALGAFALLGGLSLVAIMLPWTWLLGLGVALTAFGLVVGIPTGAYYHVALYRELSRAGEVPRRWWLHPHHHHDGLADEALGRVRPWFTMGGAGFVFIVLGIVVTVLAFAIGP